MYKEKSLPPQAPRNTTRRTNPKPHSPHQRTSLLPQVLSPSDQSTTSLLSLSHSTTSLRFSLALHSLAGPGIRARRSAGARCPIAATPARVISGKFPSSRPAFANLRPREFSEPPKEATEWESAPSGYLRSCRSRFSSVSSGNQTSSPAHLVRRRYPTVKRGRVPSLISLAPLPSAEVCPTVKRGWAPSQTLPSYREGAQLWNVSGHLLTSLSPFDPHL
jgi:hypothetical protein